MHGMKHTIYIYKKKTTKGITLLKWGGAYFSEGFIDMGSLIIQSLLNVI